MHRVVSLGKFYRSNSDPPIPLKLEKLLGLGIIASKSKAECIRDDRIRDRIRFFTHYLTLLPYRKSKASIMHKLIGCRAWIGRFPLQFLTSLDPRHYLLFLLPLNHCILWFCCLQVFYQLNGCLFRLCLTVVCFVVLGMPLEPVIGLRFNILLTQKKKNHLRKKRKRRKLTIYCVFPQ